MIVLPKCVSLDTSTLGRLSRDFWSDTPEKQAASEFLAQLSELGVYVVITFTHLRELLRHNADQTVSKRIGFLQRMPMVAWPRPYDHSWFVGSIADIGRAELHTYLHGGKRGFVEICDAIRPTLWETGVGNEIFHEQEELWSVLIEQLRKTVDRDRYIASISATEQPEINQMTLGEARRSRMQSAKEMNRSAVRLRSSLEKQLHIRGDKRLDRIEERAHDFTADSLHLVQSFCSNGGDFVEQVCQHFGVPIELAHDGMTVGQLGELATLGGKLSVMARGLNPPAEASLITVPPSSLPSLTLDRELTAIQRRADRVEGGNLGDCCLAMMGMYTDVVEVDKRTYEYLNQLFRTNTELKTVFRPIVKSNSYESLLHAIRKALSSPLA